MANQASQDDLAILARQLDFYKVGASVVEDDARKLLHEYSKIPEDQIEAHLEDIVCYATHRSCIFRNGC
jgi:hypothetical protein